MARQSAIKKFDLETYETLVAYNGDILFEWDLVTDHFYTTPNAFDIFGYLPTGEEFSKAIEDSQNIHPADKHIIKEYFETIQYNFHDLKNRKYYSRLEIRIRNAYNKFIWCKFRLVAHYSAQNLPYKISGMITDVDFDKKHKEQLLQQAQHDLLTGLYNKITATRLIEEYLSKANPENTYALILIDIDGFKAINDHFGHLFGDAVISDLASSLKQYFLKSDIIGRIGGDEFAIFTANVGSIGAFKEKLAMLIGLLRRVYRSGDVEYKISASIGIALYPAHGKTFEVLFSNADQALYYVKNHGKSDYVFYRDKMPKTLHQETQENDERLLAEKKSFDENLPEYIIKILYNTQDSTAAIQMLLEVIGKKFDVSRIFICERNADGEYYTKTFEWQNREAALLGEAEKEIPADLVESIFYASRHCHSFACSDLNTLSAPQIAYFKSVRTQSFLYCRIVESGVTKGYIGFDECRKERVWASYESDIVSFLADVLLAFFPKNRVVQKVEPIDTDNNSSLVRLLHTIDSALYIVDRYTHDVLFVNSTLNNRLGAERASGDKCYQLIFQLDQPCKTCPMQDLSPSCRRSEDEFYDKKRRCWLKRSASRIEWNHTLDCCLLQLHDITAQKDLEFMPMN